VEQGCTHQLCEGGLSADHPHEHDGVCRPGTPRHDAGDGRPERKHLRGTRRRDLQGEREHHGGGTDTLRIMPGVRLEFTAAMRLTVQGRLEAVAQRPTASSSRPTNDRRWDGIWFTAGRNGSHLSYALVEFSQASGIRLEGSSASLTHLLVRKNTMSHGLEGAYSGGAGIYVSGGRPTLIIW